MLCQTVAISGKTNNNGTIIFFYSNTVSEQKGSNFADGAATEEPRSRHSWKYDCKYNLFLLLKT
jgi:hypothetical protein